MAEASHKKKPKAVASFEQEPAGNLARALESSDRKAKERRAYIEGNPEKATREEYLQARDEYLRQVKIQEGQLFSDRDCKAHKKTLDNLEAILDQYEATPGRPLPEKDAVYAALKRIVALYHNRYDVEIKSDEGVRKKVVYLEKRLNW